MGASEGKRQKEKRKSPQFTIWERRTKRPQAYVDPKINDQKSCKEKKPRVSHALKLQPYRRQHRDFYASWNRKRTCSFPINHSHPPRCLIAESAIASRPFVGVRPLSAVRAGIGQRVIARCAMRGKHTYIPCLEGHQLGMEGRVCLSLLFKWLVVGLFVCLAPPSCALQVSFCKDRWVFWIFYLIPENTHTYVQCYIHLLYTTLHTYIPTSSQKQQPRTLALFGDLRAVKMFRGFFFQKVFRLLSDR